MSAKEAYPLSWPQGWPRTAAAKRQRAKFSTKERQYNAEGQHIWNRSRELTIYGAMRRLADELGRLGARDILVSTNVPTIKYGQPRSDRRAPGDPGVAVYFTLKGKDRVLACDRWDKVPGNIAAIAAHVDAIRAVDRYGVGTLDQAFAGYAALPAPGAHAKRPWRSVLGLLPGQSLELAERAYRALAMEHHPDHGGDAAIFTEITDAIREARQELSA